MPDFKSKSYDVSAAGCFGYGIGSSYSNYFKDKNGVISINFSFCVSCH